MKFSDEKIQEIIRNNCGNPPECKLIEYHIWLNKSKLEFYTRCPFYKGPEHIEALDSYRRLVQAGEKLLNDLAEKT